ncbi:hypothetical protein SAMD00019534_036730 [Acytostelium subglobosum LB1]|uniref:hypothetical protein n=1 Tax=Acytostelium subglobosum LB1 TaxID=1410327 RepID=UPI000644DB0C|nr:hypothetical protein SAMD00019534_036730 [Acytostelium subglobosum LB1]GAM20498.1 hypothetical protein SAMD00019534_036730 [Acytostelium subglobosum LB1]|eukprot:XP_012760019.1 hypothetical protein SAMD00019534_036730 [Acytostelium subglobosum LB1]
MNRKLIGLFLVALLCMQLVVDTHAVVAKKKKKTRVKREIDQELTKRQWYKSAVELTKQMAADPEYFKDPDAGAPKFMEGIKAAVVGASAFIPDVGPIVSPTLDVVWSAFIENTQSTPFNEEWFLSGLRAVIGEELVKFDLTDIKAKLDATGILITTFADYVDDFATSNTEGTREQVRDAYNALETGLRMHLAGDFKKAGYELGELPAFAIAATLYFMLQSEFHKNAAAWQFDAATISTQRGYFTKYLKEYTDYTRATYDTAVASIVNAPDDPHDPYTSGKKKFDKVLLLRRTLIPLVFDYVSMWWRYDGLMFPNGTYGEQVRKLFTPTGGYAVDKNSVPSPAESGGEYFFGYLSYQKHDELFTAGRFEEFRGLITQAQIKHNKEFMLAIRRHFKDPGNKNFVIPWYGSKNAPDDWVVKTMDFNPTYSDQSISLTSVAFPLEIASTSPSCKFEFSVTGGSYREETCHGIFHPTCEVSYAQWDLEKTTDLSVPGHKIGDIFTWNLNPLIMYNSYDVVDVLQVGFVPADVFAQNVAFKRLTTIIDAQKYFEYSGTVTFAKDHVTIGAHAMKISVGGALRFYVESQDLASTFSMGFRGKSSGGISFVNIYRNLDGVKTLVVSGLIGSSTSYSTFFDNYTPIQLKKDPYKKKEYLTLEVDGSDLYLSSLIFKPIDYIPPPST